MNVAHFRPGTPQTPITQNFFQINLKYILTY